MKESQVATEANQLRIAPLPEGADRPFWSVMIPTFNPRHEYLKQAIESVLAQGCDPKEMEIVVVDDCSTGVDVSALVEGIAGGRVSFRKNDRNLGLAGSWNACIERSRGTWVHILHQDDYVAAGFYRRMRAIAELHPEVGLVASRSFILDKDGAISRVGSRLLPLENGGRRVDEFFYESPLHFPGITVRRQSYEQLGGFRSDLTFALDCEMWARVIGEAGGVVTSDVLAYYRIHSENQTIRLWGSGEALADMMRLNALFSERYPEFDAQIANRKLFDAARRNEGWLTGLGNVEGARVCRNFYRRHAPIEIRLEACIEWGASFIGRAFSWATRRLFKAMNSRSGSRRRSQDQ